MPERAPLKFPAAFAFRLLVFVCVFAGFASRAHSSPVMGAGMKHEIERLLNARAMKHPLPDGWRIYDFEYSGVVVTARLGSTNGDNAVVLLNHRREFPAGRLIAETRSFRIEAPGTPGPEALRAARALAKRVSANDTRYFYMNDEMKSRESWPEYFLIANDVRIDGRVRFGVVAAALILALLLIVKGVPALRDDLIPKGAGARAALAALFFAALLVRFAAGPQAPIHCNQHGVEEIRAMVFPTSPESPGPFYGNAYPVAMRHLLDYAGVDAANVFRLNILFGSLAVLSIFMLAKSLGYTERGAFVCAALLCFSPALVWLSATESQMSFYLFVALGGLACLGAAVKTSNVPLLAVSVALIGLAASVRILTILLVPGAAIVYAFAVAENPTVDKKKLHAWAAFCFAIAGAAAFLHYKSISNMMGLGWSGLNPARYIRIFLSDKNILWDATLTPAVMPVLAAVGLLYALARRRRLAALLLSLAAVMYPLSLSLIDSRTAVVRYQAPLQWIFFLSAAAVIDDPAKLFRKPRRIAVGAVLAALFAFGSYQGLSFLHRGNVEINEHRFIKQMSTRLPGAAVIRLPLQNTRLNRVRIDFPDYLGHYRIVRGAEPSPPDAKEVIYRGLDCYSYNAPDDRNVEKWGMRAGCRNICGGNPKVIAETTLDAAAPAGGFHRTFHKMGSLHPVIGFYQCP